MNGDNVLLLVDELLRPWRFLDVAFYAGSLYGVYKLTGFVFKLIKGVRTYFIPAGRATNSDLGQKFGKWAVVTGATSALGLAYAHEFARRGINVALVSRAYDELVDVVSDLQSTYNVQAYGIHADFFLGHKVFEEIEEALQADRLEIGILVNVNPVKYDHPQYFVHVPTMRLWQMVTVNVAANTMITHLVLPRMLGRKKGAIINITSGLVYTPPTPLLSAHIASMTYAVNMSESLYEECKRKGITVQVLSPYMIAHSESLGSFFTPTPTEYVRHAIATLGVSSSCCGYWPHALMSWFHSLIPWRLWVFLASLKNRTLRKKCLQDAIDNRQAGKMFVRRLSAVPVPGRTSRAVTPTPGSLGDRRAKATPSPLLMRKVSTSDQPFVRPSSQPSSPRKVARPLRHISSSDRLFPEGKAQPSYEAQASQSSVLTSGSGSDIGSLNESVLQDLIVPVSSRRSLDSAIPAPSGKPHFQRSYSRVVVLASMARGGSVLVEEAAEDEGALPLKSAPPTIS